MKRLAFWNVYFQPLKSFFTERGVKLSNAFRLTSLAVAFFLAVPAFCANFYVSPNGSDSNDGKSPETAWATISRVNQAKEILPGDSILWERGGVWRGLLSSRSGEPGKPVTYGAYGDETKKKPAFYGSVSASKEADWLNISPNIWATRPVETSLKGRVDGNFLNPKWHIHREDTEAEILASEEDGCRKVELNVKKGGTASRQLQIWGPAPAVHLPGELLLKVKVRASRPVSLPGIALTLNTPPWTDKAVTPPIKADEEWKTLDLLFSVRDLPLPMPEGNAYVWHWSVGVLPDDTKLEIVFLDLQEVLTDKSLYLPRDVGNVIFDHGTFQKFHYCGLKKWFLSELKQPGDYWYDAQSMRVFMYWPENPAKTCKSIELALSATIFGQTNAHDVIYENLEIAYGAAHGFGGANTARITIRNCDFRFIGGGHQFSKPNGTQVRFGNAIEFWDSALDNLVEKCFFTEIYDAAITNQGRSGLQKNLTYRDNFIERSEYSFEFWCDGEMENILFERNTCVDAGVCWSHCQRPNPNGAHVMCYGHKNVSRNFVIRENKFLNSTEVCVRVDKQFENLTMQDNVYQQDEKKPIIRWEGKHYGNANFSDWQKETGHETQIP